MKILIANLGSTSFKYRLFAVEGDEVVPGRKGGYERVTNYREVIADAVATLVREGDLAGPEEIAAVGFKTVLGVNLTGCVEADAACLEALEAGAAVAPAHNPAYAAGILQFGEVLPKARRVALFETAFHRHAPRPARSYAVPAEWAEAGLVRHGFHGASHKFIAERSAELLGREDIADRVRYLYHRLFEAFAGTPLRVVSCHLGGSSSITAILNGVSVGTSMGMSPQSGLPQNNRTGDLDAMAVPFLQRELGLSLDAIEEGLNQRGGLLGLSRGVSNDLRDLRAAALSGDREADFAIDFLIHEIRRYLGSYAFQMGGLDAIVFTGGIGENDTELRAAVCAGLECYGIRLDADLNAATIRGAEGRLSPDDAPVAIYTIPANEELVVARETLRFLRREKT